MMLLTIVGGIFFVIVNMTRDLAMVALIEGFCVVYAAALIPVIRTTRRFRFWALAFLVPWAAAMLYILSMPTSAVTIFIWPLLLPLILHFVFGRRLGLILSLVALTMAAGIAAHRFGLPDGREEIAYLGNLVIASVTILVLAYVYDRAQELAEIELHRLATTDALTQLPNRGMLTETFTRMRAISARTETPLSLLLLDLDDFKRINDCHGHAAGDETLVGFARFLRQQVRESDFLFRLGGEEFMILLSGAGRHQSAAVAESIRGELECLRVPHGGESIAMTVSIGVAELGPDGTELDALLRVADRRMYQAKDAGRNRVEAGLSSPPGERTSRPS